MTEEEAIERGHRAYAELAVTQSVFDDMRAELLKRWAATGSGDTATREKMFEAFTTINTVEKALKEAVDAGKVAAHSQEMAALLTPRR